MNRSFIKDKSDELFGGVIEKHRKKEGKKYVAASPELNNFFRESVTFGSISWYAI